LNVLFLNLLVGLSVWGVTALAAEKSGGNCEIAAQRAEQFGDTRAAAPIQNEVRIGEFSGLSFDSCATQTLKFAESIGEEATYVETQFSKQGEAKKANVKARIGAIAFHYKSPVYMANGQYENWVSRSGTPKCEISISGSRRRVEKGALDLDWQAVARLFFGETVVLESAPSENLEACLKRAVDYTPVFDKGQYEFSEPTNDKSKLVLNVSVMRFIYSGPTHRMTGEISLAKPASPK
jgi:hypothetical protein